MPAKCRGETDLVSERTFGLGTSPASGAYLTLIAPNSRFDKTFHHKDTSSRLVTNTDSLALSLRAGIVWGVGILTTFTLIDTRKNI